MRIHLPIPEKKSFDVVGVGINVVDYLFRVPRFPQPDTKSDALAVTTQGGGLTATAMVACARLGLRTRYIGKFGSDEIGRMAREMLAGEDLDLGGSVQAADAPHRLCVVLVEEGTGHRTIVRHCDSRIWLQPGELSREAVCAGRLLHLDGYEGAAALQAARWAREAGIPVSLDAEDSTEQREELFRYTDILIVSRPFGRELTGRVDPPDILHGLARLGPACVGVTLGEQGSALLHRQEIVEVPAFPVEVVDTTGAGDVFHGAFLYGLLQGWKAGDILLFANAVSALKCTRLGGRAGIPRPAEVRTFLDVRGQGNFLDPS
ncbi:MAG TPA: PfkB family carbohydrate kinase [Candidatus Acidoferrum sp.]|nr:PfkB family carbohydrate kinase [Candidatus Acidoferrum sp.]